MEHDLVAQGGGLGRLLLQVAGIGQERQGHLGRQFHGAGRAPLIDAHVVDHDGDHRLGGKRRRCGLGQRRHGGGIGGLRLFGGAWRGFGKRRRGRFRPLDPGNGQRGIAVRHGHGFWRRHLRRRRGLRHMAGGRGHDLRDLALLRGRIPNGGRRVFVAAAGQHDHDQHQNRARQGAPQRRETHRRVLDRRLE